MSNEPFAWTRHGLVVLCGAGVSTPAPAGLPSWWDFNNTVLDAIRRRYLANNDVPISVQSAINELQLEQIGVVRFSQVVSDAFAGRTWFRLLRCLDASTPNAVHQALAGLAASGVLKAVVTTNFDTLLERACRDVVAVQVVHTADSPPDQVESVGKPLIVKLHGTATRPTTLVDLATQKARGLPKDWTDWLEILWKRHAVLVLGFSGSDIAIGGDYLRLTRGSRSSPWLRWNVREGSRPTAGAAAVVDRAGRSGGYLIGDLPQALQRYGVEIAESPSPRRPRRPLDEEVAAWLDHNSGDAGACGVAVARFLRETAEPKAAKAIYERLRVGARTQLAAGVSPEVAAQLTLVLAQVGYDTAREHPKRAIKDIELAVQAYQAVVDGLGGPKRLPPRGRHEWASTISGLYQRLARAHLNMRHHRAAQDWNRSAAQFFDQMTPEDRRSRLTASAEIDGVAAFYRGDYSESRRYLKEARALALDDGRVDVADAIGKNLSLLDATAGT